MKNEINKRLPRPTGVTFLSLEYQKTNTNENKDKLLSHIISNYTINGFRWNNKPTTIPELSMILKISTREIMAYISNVSENLGSLASSEQIESTLKSIITLSTSWSIQDRGIIQAQVERLLKAQGDHYKPFISSEVNKSLKLILESNKNLMENYKTFFTSNNTNVINIFGKANQDPQSLLTPENALDLIHNNANKALPASLPQDDLQNDLEKLFQEHAVGDCPTCLEGRTGTEALMPYPTSESLEALELESPHTAVSRRRGEPEYDDEELPNRADD